MKIKKDIVNKQGKRVVIAELGEGEELIAVDKNAYYRLGGQMDDVVTENVITDSQKVSWDIFDQTWRD